MQRGQSGRDDFFGFGDPFAGFGGFGRPGSLMPSFFGGRDPFDDPFFTQPFGGMPVHGMFGTGGRPFGDLSHGGFIEQAPEPMSKGPIIRELSSDDEERQGEESTENTRKHSSLGKVPFVEEPDEEMEERKNRHMKHKGEFSRASATQPQTRSYSFHSSSVTYGGPNGAYYTSSTTRRAGGDGVTVEESKEADTTTGKATHRISKGLHDKGHSVTRKLGSDGRVETAQTLHNLNEDELAGFEEAWKGNARQHLPGWNQNLDMLADGYQRGGGSGWQTGQASSRGWALPSSTEHHVGVGAQRNHSGWRH